MTLAAMSQHFCSTWSTNYRAIEIFWAVSELYVAWWACLKRQECGWCRSSVCWMCCRSGISFSIDTFSVQYFWLLDKSTHSVWSKFACPLLSSDTYQFWSWVVYVIRAKDIKDSCRHLQDSLIHQWIVEIKLIHKFRSMKIHQHVLYDDNELESKLIQFSKVV